MIDMGKNYDGVSLPRKYYLMQPVVEVFTPRLFRFLLVAAVAVFKCSQTVRIRVRAGSLSLGSVPVLIVPEIVWRRETREQYEQRMNEKRRETSNVPMQRRIYISEENPQ